MTNKFKVGAKLRRVSESTEHYTKDKTYKIKRNSSEYDCDFILGGDSPVEHYWSIESLYENFEIVTTKKQRLAEAEQAISVLDSEVGTIKMRLDEYEALVGRVSALEEKQAETVEIKAGDYIKNTGDDADDLTIGKVYEVLRVDDDGDYRIIDDAGDANYIASYNCEKAEEPIAEPTQYKVGDVVIIGGEVRVIVFVSEGLYRYRNVLASNVGDDLSPYWSAHTAIKRYATAEEIASVGK